MPAASWLTLTRRAAALEKANKGRPTARSKALRAEAARLRRLTRKRAKAIVALLDVAQPATTNEAGKWFIAGTEPSTPAVEMTYSNSAMEAMKREQREQMEADIVRGLIGRHGMLRVGPYEPFVLSGEEANALMEVLDRAGYITRT